MSKIFQHEEAKKSSIWIPVLLIFFASSCLFLKPVWAQAPVPDDQTYRIAKQLNCPTCAGRNLADCPTETCTQWKNEIKAQLDQGKNAEQVLAYFEARFGPTVLQEPPKGGTTAILWAAPVGAAIVFFGVVGLVMWRMSQRRPAQATAVMATGNTASASANVDPFVSELEREVKDES